MKEEFVLPEKWYIKVNEKNSGVLYHWLLLQKGFDKTYSPIEGYVGNNSREGSYQDWSSGGYSFEDLGHILITTEQFLKYIYKQDNNIKMEKRVKGYKLKEDCKQYEESAAKICSPECKHLYGSVEALTDIEKLRKAGVLDLWFEPVWFEPVCKEEFKVGDWITFVKAIESEEEEFLGVSVQITDISDNPYHIKWIKHNPKSFTGGGFRLKPYENSFRLATSKEIKAAEFPQIESDGCKGEFFNNFVKFGRAEIDKSIFINLKNLCDLKLAFNVHSNKFIESVTIGKGTFTKDQIKEIAEYYLNKK